jgi:dolichyl-phosphate-mannose-protein mannosyltransferase
MEAQFASYYLQRTYFFDVHPPFGKLLFALMGWFVGYDGHFLFDNIGDSYIDNKVPYVAFRALPAVMGSMTVPTVFLIMWESGYSLPAAVLASGLVLFDNAHIGQTRLILLDATLVFFMAVSVLAYIRFYKFRNEPFGRKWWKWLLITGISMSCVMSTKYVGAFTFFTVGLAVAIDLWDLLDVNRKEGALDLVVFCKHFAARALGFIVVPFLMYLFWFQVHFAILSRSGPGDDFMTPEFQETLSDNLMHASSIGINYYDTITLRHKETKTYLHSHPDTYPLRYDDGRISSQGQQVTGYPFNDTNNHWQILPQVPTHEGDRQVRPVLHGEVVQLRHLVTNMMLLTHDVASPFFPTNQEFTAVTIEQAVIGGERHNDTLFEIRLEQGKPGQQFKSMSGQFKLVHHPTKVAMWTHTTPLPDWAYKQAEINGNKNVQQSSNIWYTDEIPSLPADSPRLVKEPRKVKSLPFLKKYFELQRSMFYHNNALTSSHPYASQPYQWPFLLRGVSFWTQNDTKQQIYFLGNPIGYWITACLLAVFAGVIGADQLSLRRGIDALDRRMTFRMPFTSHLLTIRTGTRNKLYNSTGFFFLCWAAHYLPFFLMGRQLFLHHYLPAHLASCLVTGALVEFVCNVDPVIDDDVVQSRKEDVKKVPEKVKRGFSNAQHQLKGQGLYATWAVTGLIMAVVVYGWYFFLPLTYGKPGLSVDEVNARKWLNYDLHFAK